MQGPPAQPCKVLRVLLHSSRGGDTYKRPQLLEILPSQPLGVAHYTTVETPTSKCYSSQCPVQAGAMLLKVRPCCPDLLEQRPR
jgi:hypothetical protein